MEPHRNEAIERAVLTLREMTQERRGRGISAVMMLEEQINALRKDAERYSKLRARAHSLTPLVTDPLNSMLTYTPDGLDAALDALPAVGAA